MISVNVLISNLSRLRLDGRNIKLNKCYIPGTSKQNENFYLLCVFCVFLKQFYTRINFTVCKEAFVVLNEVPAHEVCL